MKHKLLLLVVLLHQTLFLTSCANLNDTTKDLGGGYYYSTDSKWKKICPNSVYYNTAIYSEVTDYNFDKDYIIVKQKPDYEHQKIFMGEDWGSRYDIYCNFLQDSTSKRFYEETSPFIRKSISADSILYKLLNAKGVTDQNSITDKQTIETVLDSVFHYDPYYIRLFAAKENYWIIDKKRNKRFGPLTKKEFNAQCALLKLKIVLERKS